MTYFQLCAEVSRSQHAAVVWEFLTAELRRRLCCSNNNNDDDNDARTLFMVLSSDATVGQLEFIIKAIVY